MSFFDFIVRTLVFVVWLWVMFFTYIAVVAIVKTDKKIKEDRSKKQ